MREKVLRPPLATLLPRALHGLPKAFIGEGFEQVIERAELKRFERVLIVSSDKNQRRRALMIERGQYIKAIFVRHLHIQKSQVGRELANFINRLLTITAFTDDLDVRFGGQQDAQPFSGLVFIIHDESLDFIHIYKRVRSPCDCWR